MTTPLPLRIGELERRGLRDRVYDLVLEMLLEGDLDPGSRLSIDTLAKQLDVSPTPVREAMVQLERTGLVTREALKGYRVAPPFGPEELSELFDARLMLEVEATRLAGFEELEARRFFGREPALSHALQHDYLTPWPAETAADRYAERVERALRG